MRWADQDSYGHINNVSQARYFEEARVRAFFGGFTREETGLGGLIRDDRPDGLKMVVASQTINFLQNLEYSNEPIEVEMWIGRLGGSSIDLFQQLVSLQDGVRTVTTVCSMTAVVVHGTTMRPQRLTEEFREIAKLWMDEPLQLRRS